MVEEMEMHRRADTDLLTGLCTRRFLDEVAQHELGRARRTGQSLTVALIDIDKFRIVNDTFGHGAGDAVLRAIGQICRNSLRGSDVMARYGGEKMVMLLSNTSLAQAAPVMERLRRNIMAMLVPELMGKWVVTASIGAAELNHKDTEIAEVLVRADIALYRAKETGRNRVELALAA